MFSSKFCLHKTLNVALNVVKCLAVYKLPALYVIIFSLQTGTHNFAIVDKLLAKILEMTFHQRIVFVAEPLLQNQMDRTQLEAGQGQEVYFF
jgi:hypothetical protein